VGALRRSHPVRDGPCRPRGSSYQAFVRPGARRCPNRSAIGQLAALRSISPRTKDRDRCERQSPRRGRRIQASFVRAFTDTRPSGSERSDRSGTRSLIERRELRALGEHRAVDLRNGRWRSAIRETTCRSMSEEEAAPSEGRIGKISPLSGMPAAPRIASMTAWSRTFGRRYGRPGRARCGCERREHELPARDESMDVVAMADRGARRARDRARAPGTQGS